MAATLRCPRDGAEAFLKSVQGRKGQFRLDVCLRCGGAWFVKGEITKISGDKEIERMTVEYAGGPSSLACPRCGREMVTRPVGDVTLDICAKCKGVWVDAGELENAARTLRGEFSDVHLGETPGFSRAVAMANSAFGPSGTLARLVLKPPVRRKYPPDNL